MSWSLDFSGSGTTIADQFQTYVASLTNVPVDEVADILRARDLVVRTADVNGSVSGSASGHWTGEHPCFASLTVTITALAASVTVEPSPRRRAAAIDKPEAAAVTA